jgi:Cyclophilin type peptidyl-prolyl cis-trans isomerase/CLD
MANSLENATILRCRDSAEHRWQLARESRVRVLWLLTSSGSVAAAIMSLLLETSLGDIVIDLEVEACPKTCENFLKLCKVYYYNLNAFFNGSFVPHTHRVFYLTLVSQSQKISLPKLAIQLQPVPVVNPSGLS